MTAPVAHDRAVEELEIVALGAAPADVTAGVLAHVSECSECRAEMDELTLLLAALTVVIPDSELNRGRSAGIRSRLMARANADIEAAGKRRVDAAAKQKAQNPAARIPALAGWERMARAPEEKPIAVEARETPIQPARALPPPDHRPAGSRLGLPVLLWAIIATVALLGSGAAAMLLWRGRSEIERGAAAQVAELEGRTDSLAQVLAERERAVEMLTGPGVRVVDLVNWASGGRPIARVFWDTQSNRWSLFVYELRPPRAGHTYQLWALTAQGRISAGTFLPAADGTARLESAVTLEPGSVGSVFITEEPLPSSRQPTGRPLAAGSF